MKTKHIRKSEPKEGEKVLIIKHDKTEAYFATLERFNMGAFVDITQWRKEGGVFFDQARATETLEEFPYWVRLESVLDSCFRERRRKKKNKKKNKDSKEDLTVNRFDILDLH